MINKCKIALLLQLWNISTITYGFLATHKSKYLSKTIPKERITQYMKDNPNNDHYSTNDNLTHTKSMKRRDVIALGGYITGMKSYNALLSNANAQETTIPKVKLGSLSISRTIQGYWQLAGGHGKYKEGDAINNMKHHYKSGITTLDTADIYGPSESIMGKFVKDVGLENVVPCTKFCCFRFLDEIDKNEVRTRILKSCERLQVSQLPLVQFFWSNYDSKRYVDVALMLTELKEEGLIKEIGATNFDLKRLQELKKADVPIVSHQVQLSAMDRRPIQSGMSDWCNENDIKLIAFGTVGSGILSNKYLDAKKPASEQLNTSSLRMYAKTASRFGDWKLVQELLHTMNDIATSVNDSGRGSNVNIGNVAQRYVLDGTPSVASVLIGVRNCDHIEENVRTHSFSLRQDEIDAIDNVVRKRDGPKGDVWDLERGYI